MSIYISIYEYVSSYALYTFYIYNLFYHSVCISVNLSIGVSIIRLTTISSFQHSLVNSHVFKRHGTSSSQTSYKTYPLTKTPLISHLVTRLNVPVLCVHDRERFASLKIQFRTTFRARTCLLMYAQVSGLKTSSAA